MLKRLRSGADVKARRVGDRIVLVHFGSDDVWELNTTGSRFWEALQESNGVVATARAVLLDEYDVQPVALDAEIDTLIAELVAASLLIPDHQ
jgi:hypothetical protein